jgi:hypothetical protein
MKIRHVLLVMAVVVTAVLVAAPARAVAGTRYVSKIGPSGSPGSVVVTAGCPSGTAAVGGGAVVGGSTRVRINAAVPGPDGFTVLAVEPSGGISEQWHLVVTAVCVPTASVPGLLYASAFSASDSAAGHSATVECPSGRRVVGMGGLIDSNNIGQDRLTLAGIRPDGGLGTLTAVGYETDQDFAGYWRVKATAACAYPLAGLSRIAVASTAFDSTEPKLVRTACPAGTTVLSAGFDVYFAAGAAAVPSYFPDLDVAGVPNRPGIEVSAREIGSGFAGSWWLAGYGICAT